MGSAVSAGSDNDELTDNLCNADYIRTTRVERLFRAVDRGEYILPEHRMNAYKDQAWRSNHLHLSAPCIYSEVLEGLGLAPGMSFLNLGSGTGYLSTLVGLILGSSGINHGVEYFDDVIQYANKKLDDFKRYSGAVDEFDFCEPKFMQGNCLCLTSDRRYDRVYVGAACPVPFDHYLKNFVKIGGILVMPFHDQLLQVRRESETNWDICSLLPVSFATLILPKEDTKESYDLMDIQPESLQWICRNKIRNILRSNVECERPELCRPADREKKSPRKSRYACIQPYNDLTLAAIELEGPLQPMHPMQLIREILHQSESSSDDNDDEPQEQQQNTEVAHSPDETMQQEPQQQRDVDEEEEEGIETEATDNADNSDTDNNKAKRPCNDNTCQGTSSTSNKMEVDTECDVQDETVKVKENVNGTGMDRSNAIGQPKTDHQRRKFDSGIGDDDDESNDDDEPVAVGQNSKRTKLAWFNKFLKTDKSERGFDSSSTSSCDTIEVDNGTVEDIYDDDDEDADDDDGDGDSDDEEAPAREQMEYYHKRRTVDSPFTELMSKKINELPLPSTLKSFLNFYRF